MNSGDGICMSEKRIGDADEKTCSEEFRQFLEICKIPRCSGNNAMIGKYLMDFASENGLKHEMDDTGNVYIDREGRKTGLILQSHMDMVAITADGHRHDWNRDPIEVCVKDGKVSSKNTTLGADDGAGMAIMLTALTSEELDGIGFRCLFTVDEETGLKGALNVNPKWLEGYRFLINIDNEDLNDIVVGCAGNTVGSASYTPTYEPIAGDMYKLYVHGLLGRHSAIFIKDHANAIVLAARYLEKIDNARIAYFASGETFNVIPSAASVVFTVPEGTDVDTPLSETMKEIRRIYIDTKKDPDIKMEMKKLNGSDYKLQWDVKSTKKFIRAVNGCPNGLLEESIEGFISSMNLGRLYNMGNKLYISFMIRSVKTDSLRKYFDKIRTQFERIGGTAIREIDAKGWSEKPESTLVVIAKSTYRKLFGKEPGVTVMHAAVECGVLTSINPGLSTISIGPDICNPHSVDETMDIESLSKTKDLTFSLIKSIAKI